MFNPEMMASAQRMMANMKPEDMQRMSQMAAGMDPKMMESMMKNMGGGNMPGNVDTAEALKQMQNMTPDQMKQGMAQASTQMNAQKQYMYNASEMLKNEGNAEVKKEDYPAALTKYNKALDNLKAHTGDDVSNMKVNLLNNTALCYLKTKEYDKALESSEEALKISPSSHKALFRRGSALEAKGELGDAVLDLRRAAEIAPSDGAIGRELTRLRADLKAKGIDESKLVDKRPVQKHEVASAWQQSSSSSAPAPSAGGAGSKQWADAAEKMAENPDMLREATETMAKMSPDELQAMLSNAPMPPGMDANAMKAQMEHLRSNPDLLKTAMDSLKSMPEEERKRMLGQRYGGNGGSSSASASGAPASFAPSAMMPAGGGGMPDMRNMSPDMISQALNMTKTMTPDQLKAMNIGSPEEAEMMQKTAQQLQSNPDMMDMMTKMMQNMDPKQMEDMMNMSSKFRGGGGGAGGGNPNAPMDPSAMMNDPDMMKAAESMMASMSPEMLSSMAKASGVELSEDKAKLVTKFLPWIMRLMRLFGYLKRLWTAMWSAKGRIVIAVLVVLVAMIQHFRG